MKSLATVGNLLWAASNLPAWAAFHRALANPKAAQQAVLRRILRRAAGTAFGREHGFDRIHGAADFAANVPLRDYADFEPWINRIRNGEPNVLTAEPVKRLATTGGTSGRRKLIPHTAGLQAEFNRAVGPWIVDLFVADPTLMWGAAYWSVSPVVAAEEAGDAVPIGFDDDSQYLGGIRRRLIDAVMAVPASVRHAPTIEHWRRETIQRLARRTDLRLISVWHPSFLSLLLDEMLELPQVIWPRLRLVSCWGDGHALLAMEQLARRLPHVRFQPKGLIATEGIVSIPFGGRWPLAIRSHFLEFLRQDGSICLAHKLREGESYEVAITTGGGLYRYRLNDRVRVDGWMAQTPSIRFVGKVEQISDRFGEKLSEAFVGEVLRSLMRQADARWRFAMLAPDGCRYALYFEGDVCDAMARLLDAALRQNPQYAYCRDLGQLQQPAMFRIARDAEPAYLARLLSLGRRLGDIKPAALSPLADWQLHFSGEWVKNS